MGYVTTQEGRPWQEWLDALAAAGRVAREGERWFATEATRDPKAVLRGRLEALGPVFSDDPLLAHLEAEGVVLRARIDGKQAWCDRRLLARIHRYTIDRLRKEIEPVTASQFLAFLSCWQHVDPAHKVEGPRGAAAVVEQLAGFELPAPAWEGMVLPARVRGYKREWLDQLTLSGEVAWGRLWGSGLATPRRTPLTLLLRQDLDDWAALAAATVRPEPREEARAVEEALRTRGAMFAQELARAARLPAASVEIALGELVALGRVTCDSFGGLRWLLVPGWRRRSSNLSAGRWSVLRQEAGPPRPEFVARQLLKRTGVVFRKTLVRERLPLTWREIARACREMEARGDIRGGRFVAGFDGEQYALAEAVTLLRAVRRRGPVPTPTVPAFRAGDPLDFRGILTPDPPASRALPA
jgi:ATP-dependent Lhr-like helicase